MITMDSIKAVGAVLLQVYKDDQLVSTVEDNNLVVNLGRTNVSRLLGGDAAGKAITQIGIGTNGAATALSDTTLTNLFKKAISSVSYPDLQSVRFEFDILAEEGNGITIRELGLFSSGDVLFARKVRTGEIVKDATVRITGSWTITVN